MDNNERLAQLEAQLNVLLKRQASFQVDVNMLRNEINSLRNSLHTDTPPVQTIKHEPVITPPFQEVKPPVQDVTPPVHQVIHPVQETEVVPPQQKEQPVRTYSPPPPPSIHKPLIAKEDWEKFIGENLINKIGIIILVLGVGIGAKYAIDKGYITPLTRIIFGYITGATLLGVAMRLKKSYENYSAVLLSGAMAIMYFISFAAYSFYNLIPDTVAFGLMVLFTVFTVIAAIQYNRQVIALVGLVGAYAVPFLLSDGSGRVVILFSYTAIINCGILVLAFRKYWKPLFYTAFALSWMIYMAWYSMEYKQDLHQQLAFAFLSIFFVQFYITTMAYKLIRSEKFAVEDIFLVLVNSFIFYGIGYLLLDRDTTGQQLQGLFTLANAIIHFAVCVLVYKRQAADRNLFNLIAGMVLLFITIAIPVQLNGHWVTLVWALEAALLYWIGRTKNTPFYEYFSYPMAIIAFVSLIQDWSMGYNLYYIVAGTSITPVFNIHFLSSALVIAAFGGMSWINNRYVSAGKDHYLGWSLSFSYVLSLMLLLTTYGALFLEIYIYWQQAYNASEFTLPASEGGYYINNMDMRSYQVVWLINYSLLFVSALTFFNLKRLKSTPLAQLCFVLTMVFMVVFLTAGLFAISELRESYLTHPHGQYYHFGIFNLLVRYVSLGFLALLMYTAYLNTREGSPFGNFKKPYELILHTTILWVASTELINWIAIIGLQNSYKLHLSILWGCYALLLIVLGIWKNKQHLRIAAIVLFTGTLLKLFFYDISYLDTIAKTIVFVSLGVLLLIISFLYNKYKHVIAGETKSE